MMARQKIIMGGIIMIGAITRDRAPGPTFSREVPLYGRANRLSRRSFFAKADPGEPQGIYAKTDASTLPGWHHE